MQNDDLMVSISCTTYNHKPFITQTMEGFLMQKTNFNYNIIVGDDCSTDGAPEILKSFKEKHPDKIHLMNYEKNVGAHQNMANTIKLCKGKYIALCDGDDYWTNTHKLQKQIDFLEAHPEYVICCHYTRVIDQHNNALHLEPNPVPLEYTYHDLLAGKQAETKTATVVFRNLAEIQQLFDTPLYFNSNAADKILKLYATFKTGLKVYVMPEVMSCYRNHVGGVWSMIKNEVRMEKMISDFNLIIKNFGYGSRQRHQLLLLYVKRYLMFELSRLRIRKVHDTVKYLI